MGEELWNLAVALDEDVDEILSNVLVAVVVERGRKTLVADTSSASDAVDVLRDAAVRGAWQVVVDDVTNVLDVPTTSRDTGGDEDGSTTSAEGTAVSMLADADESDGMVVVTYMASSRSRWLRSAWMEVVGRPRL